MSVDHNVFWLEISFNILDNGRPHNGCLLQSALIYALILMSDMAVNINIGDNVDDSVVDSNIWNLL
jgi:hypothetical protein